MLKVNNKNSLKRGVIISRKQMALRDFFWSLVIVTLLFGTVHPMSKLSKNANFDTVLSPFVPLLVMMLISLLFGMILGLPWLISRWNEYEGFNWLKFFIQGLPALIFAFPMFVLLSLLDIKNFNNNLIPWYNLQAFSYNDYLIIFSSIWFGKTLIDCIKGHKSNQ